ncbi:MAG: hypothetical protein AB201_02205 [Parcubacteria bacterium C7867-006]|nr:MAG: hypothetical protein AB201_02205 [Parcubacteria bacterium C7867-006]
MKNKNIVISLSIIFALALIGYFFFYNKSAQNTKNPNSTAKINIEAVCQGALAYMTFPDSKSADIYVEECIEGKHPEVIERYKASLNLDAGVAI